MPAYRLDFGRGCQSLPLLVVREIDDQTGESKMGGWNVVAALALAGIMFSLGSHIPLPGIDAAVFAGQLGRHGNGSTARMSIFALGLTPIYTAFTLAEIGRLLAYRRQSPQRQPNIAAAIFVRLIAFAVTALQGYGIAAGLRSSNLIDPSFEESLVLLIIAAFMGATAVMFLLIDRLPVPGLRNGFWALWTIPGLIQLPGALTNMLEMTRQGVISTQQWVPALGYSILSVAAVVAMALLWRTTWHRDGAAAGQAVTVEPREILIWPPVLALSISSYLLTAVIILLPDGLNMMDQRILQIAALATAALFIPAVVYGYARQYSAAVPDGAPLAFSATVIAAIQILVFTSAAMINTFTDLPVVISGLTAIALTLTALGLREGATFRAEQGLPASKGAASV
ncbi:preprotein translocase subunit SecY [Rhizobium deserti]|uniref:Preprotein translocase subunit SecY n=1 Tax=Rhizobium deserti TaxID=2547961 RepID=A0A4R5UK67_9HYPH|nr:preprotein translocase subunit SecY [Rhizobium deserti]TDK37204.1 preprotein translocase subunit SecY [Rhizobium deserti]